MDGTKILNNTTVAAWWANGLRVAGGKNVVVKDNLVMDPAANCGMEISIFGDTSQALESATVTGNVILRGGGWNSIRHGVNISGGKGIPATIVFNNNVVAESRRMGVNIGGKLLSLTFHHNIIRGSATTGIQVGKDIVGAGSFTANQVLGPPSGNTAFINQSPATFVATLSANSW